MKKFPRYVCDIGNFENLFYWDLWPVFLAQNEIKIECSNENLNLPMKLKIIFNYIIWKQMWVKGVASFYNSNKNVVTRVTRSQYLSLKERTACLDGLNLFLPWLKTTTNSVPKLYKKKISTFTLKRNNLWLFTYSSYSP